MVTVQNSRRKQSREPRRKQIEMGAADRPWQTDSKRNWAEHK